MEGKSKVKVKNKKEREIVYYRRNEETYFVQVIVPGKRERERDDYYNKIMDLEAPRQRK